MTAPEEAAAGDAIPLERCATRLVDPERVDAVRKRMAGEGVSDQLAAVFRMLAEPARVRIVSALLEAGELCVCDLAAVVGLSETATSQHLRMLRGADAVRNRRAGRVVYYSLADAHVRMLLDLALTHVQEPAQGGTPLAKGEMT